MGLPDFDRHITTDPFDDGAECRDEFGWPYPEHEWPEPEGPSSCLRCGAELEGTL